MLFSQHVNSFADQASALPPVVAVSPGANFARRAVEWLSRCISGDWDWSQFGNGVDDSPRDPKVRNAISESMRLMLTPYGTVRKMTLLGHHSFTSNEGHHRTAYTYEVAFEKGTVKYDFALDSDGYVGALAITARNKTLYFYR